MANLIERNFQLLASMGVRLAPRSVEKLSSLCAGGGSGPFARSPVIEQIQCVEVEIAKTKSLFTGESDVLRPCAYSSPIDFPDRHSCVGHEMHGDSDCHLNLLVQELVAFCRRFASYLFQRALCDCTSGVSLRKLDATD